MCTFQPFQALLAGRLVCTNTEAKYVRPPWPEISLYESLTADISAAIKSSYEIGSVLSEVGWSTVHSVLDRCDPLLPVTYCSQESDTVCPPPHISTPLNLLKTHTGEKSYKCEHIKVHSGDKSKNCDQCIFYSSSINLSLTAGRNLILSVRRVTYPPFHQVKHF